MTILVCTITAAVFGGIGYILGAVMATARQADEAAEMQVRLRQQSETIIELSLKNAHYRKEYLMMMGEDYDDLK